ncbi:unnamed protein product [Rotaria sp. Silwood1]|nr:unnamed protein product [Rotaria sp. Silwood1]CAF1270437.1 unnamed protein product [Rotaria sp. Silwood1]CAF3507279.1 unnamed protein product [Rotaria sp. Silwood1]CAF3531817.1 unnamed protein product [Rotaria sp. Silwood1]
MLLRFNNITAILIGLTSATDAFNNSSNCSQYGNPPRPVINTIDGFLNSFIKLCQTGISNNTFLLQIDTGELLNYTDLDGNKRHACVYNGKQKQQQLPLVVWLHGALISSDFGIEQHY